MRRIARGLVARAVAAVAFVGFGASATRHALAEQEQRQERSRRLASLLAALEELRPPTARGSLHVTLNGATSTITFSSSELSVSNAAAAVAAACGTDREEDVVSPTEPRDRAELSRPRRRELARREDSVDGSASAILCVSSEARRDSSAANNPARRLTTIRRDGEARSFMISVATTSGDQALDVMFPATGDAPGGDLARVPRPPHSRRTLAASIEETGHAVRVYELQETTSPAAALASFDATMRAAGFESSSAVASEVTRSRLYTRGPERIVVTIDDHSHALEMIVARVNLL